MSNPRVPYEMYTDRKSLRPLKGKPIMAHVVVNVEHWPFDQAMPRAALPAPHGKAPIPDVGNFFEMSACNVYWIKAPCPIGR